ncbi:MAG: CPBP family intramembrane glutamic endopeptidase [Polyangiales bacterium]
MSAPPRPRVWTPLLAFALYLAVVVAGTGVTIALYLGARADPAHLDAAFTLDALNAAGRSLSGILLAGLVSSLAGAGVAVGAASLSPEGIRARLRLVAAPRVPGLALAASLTLLGTGALSTAVTRALHLENRGTLPLIRAALRAPSPAMLALSVLIIGVAAGAGEELFFRGYLLTRLARRWRPWVGNAVVALLFALMHLDPVHSSFAFLVGLALGWVSLRARSIWPTVLAHIANNTLSVVGTATETGEDHAPLLALFVGGPLAMALGLGLVARLTRGTVRGDEHIPT